MRWVAHTQNAPRFGFGPVPQIPSPLLASAPTARKLERDIERRYGGGVGEVQNIKRGIAAKLEPVPV